MTDTMFTRTALTEAAKGAGVTTDQARTILEAAGVKVEPEKPAPGWYLTEDGEVARVKPNKHTGALILHMDGDVLLPHQTWPKLTPARIVPAAAPVTLTEDQALALRAEVDPANRSVPALPRELVTKFANAVLAQYAAPAEGEPIDVADVREGDRVRVEFTDGDVWEIRVSTTHMESISTTTDLRIYHGDIRTVYLLDREGEG